MRYLLFFSTKTRDLKLGAQLVNVLNRSLKQLTGSFVSDSTCICGSIRDRRTCNAAVSSITFHKHALRTQAHFIKSTCGNCIEGHYSLCRKKLSRERRLLCHGISPLDVVFEFCSASFVTYMQLKSHASSIKEASL